MGERTIRGIGGKGERDEGCHGLCAFVGCVLVLLYRVYRVWFCSCSARDDVVLEGV